MSETIHLLEIAKNLSNISWRILDSLRANGHVNFGEIRKVTELSQEKCYKEIARLEGGLLIESRKDPADSRYVQYYLTQYGEQILEYKQ